MRSGGTVAPTRRPSPARLRGQLPDCGDHLLRGESTAEYGIFSSDSAGDGASWSNIYASNFNDSGMYVGACQQVCDVTISKAWMEYNALGYSGPTRRAVVIKDSLFDNNQTASTPTPDQRRPPAPQNGDCPGNAISPITTPLVLVAMDNTFEDNNNRTHLRRKRRRRSDRHRMTLSGGRNDTVMHNTFKDNGAWGSLHPYPTPRHRSTTSPAPARVGGGHSFAASTTR